MAQLAQLSYVSIGEPLFLLAKPEIIDLSGIILSNQNGQLAVDGVPIAANNWSDYSTINSTIAFNISSATLLATEAAGIPSLSFNGNVLAYVNDIPALRDWSMYPATQSLDMSGNNIINANVGTFSTLYTNTFYPVNTVNSSSFLTSTLTAQEINVASTLNFINSPCNITGSGILDIYTGQSINIETQILNIITDVGNVTVQSASDIILTGQSTIVSSNTFTVLQSSFFAGPVDFGGIAPTNLPGITDGAVATSTVTASSIFTANLSANVVLLSTLSFAPTLGGVNVDMGMGKFFGDTAAWAGASFGLAAGVGSIVAIDRFATGTVAPIIARVTNYLQPSSDTVELVNVTTQLQISTVGSIQSSILRLASTLTVGGSLQEVFVSSYINNGTTCIRSLSDPLNTISTGTSSFVQAFGQWTAIPMTGGSPTTWSNYPTLNSTITFNVNNTPLVSQVSSTTNFLTYDNKQLAITTNNNVYSYDFWVSPNGSNSVGTGAILSPWLTITYALTQIAGLVSTNPVTIHLMTGVYNESPTITRNCTYIEGTLCDPFNGSATPAINITGTVTFTIGSTVGSNVVNCGLMNLSMNGFVYNGTYNIAGANTCTLRNCCINNANTAIICYQQFNTAASQHTVYLNNCYITNPVLASGVCYLNSGTMTVNNTTITNALQYSLIYATTVGAVASNINIRNSIIQQTANSNAPLALIKCVTAMTLDISYSRLIYTFATVDVSVNTNKCCIQMSAGTGASAINNFVGNYLYCEGARATNGGTQYQCIQKAAGTSIVNLFYGYTACGPTANHISNTAGMNATAAVALS